MPVAGSNSVTTTWWAARWPVHRNAKISVANRDFGATRSPDSGSTTQSP